MEREINEHTGTGVVTFQQRGRRNAIPVGEAGSGARGTGAGGEGGWVSVFLSLHRCWGHIVQQEGEMMREYEVRGLARGAGR